MIFLIFTDSQVWLVTTHVSLENNLVTVLSKRSLVKCPRLWDARQTAGKAKLHKILISSWQEKLQLMYYS